jgi:protein gp37
MYKRFKWNEEVRYVPETLKTIAKIKKPSRIFLCSTHDLFGEWISDKWIFDIITKIQSYEHTFLLLTKNPERYKHWSFRKNFWLGQTVVHKEDYVDLRIPTLSNNIKFVSFEPLLDEKIGDYYFPADWFIIGGLTPTPKHSHQCINKILVQASRFGVPVFIKHNARYPQIRQQFPKTELLEDI